MNGLIGLFSLSALLLVASGEFPDLSPSYSFQGSFLQTIDGQLATATYTRAVDTTRRLQYTEVSGTLPDGSSLTVISLYSENDNASYASVNGVCTLSTFPSTFNPIDNNIWEPFAAATESPAGTFTYTQGEATFVLTIVNGEPAVITTSYSNSLILITVTNFESPPPFSIFSLPSECTCTACYSSAVSVSISVLLLLTTLLLYLFATH